MRISKLRLVLLAFVTMFLVFAVSADAAAPVGSFTVKTKEISEVGGSWRLFVKLELPKAPLTPHQSMRFVFTKTMVYERSLIDGKDEPVTNRTAVQNASPSTESLDVSFGDATGKVFKTTTFDFALTRTREYEAGEYTVEVHMADGTVIGGKQNIILNGNNPPVDRRAMAFNAKDPKVKKVDGYDAGANQAKNDDPTSNNSGGNGEVTPMGTATGFVPKEGMQETEEEKIKTKPGGCGCEAVGTRSPASALFAFLPLFGIGLAAYRRRRRVA